MKPVKLMIPKRNDRWPNARVTPTFHRNPLKPILSISVQRAPLSRWDWHEYYKRKQDY